MRLLFARPVRATALAFAAVLGLAGPAFGATITFPKGVACSYELQVDITGGNQQFREFKDKDGNVVRTLATGRGTQLVFTNTTNSQSDTLKSNGSVQKVTYNSDGTQTWVTTGHNVLILYPEDRPAGPSTILYVGRVTFTVETDGTFTLQGTTGASVDICAFLK